MKGSDTGKLILTVTGVIDSCEQPCESKESL